MGRREKLYRNRINTARMKFQAGAISGALVDLGKAHGLCEAWQREASTRGDSEASRQWERSKIWAETLEHWMYRKLSEARGARHARG